MLWHCGEMGALFDRGDIATHIDRNGGMGKNPPMKTTIDISEHLLLQAKALARAEGTTLKNLTEEGLELVLTKHASREGRQARPVVCGGKGLSAAFQGKSWSEIRDEIYRGYGT